MTEQNGVYYTTDDIKKIFMWSNMTIYRKRNDGTFPNPDIEGRPNKWLKSKINDMFGVGSNPKAGVEPSGYKQTL
tara:strand:- start:133 stop:357 length:225 start_codon:yes stop_codon:yes gene_type:complete